MKEDTFIFDRAAAIEYLKERDGEKCQFPDCKLPFDSGKHALTIDHIYPQSKAREDGWTFEKIWSYENLQLMGKSCNARKGNLLYDENGNLPLTERRVRVDKSQRRPPCGLCEDGRLLFENEICGLCGSLPGPPGFPKYLQRTPKECEHGWGVNPEEFCWLCNLGFVERKPASQIIVDGP